MNRAVALAASLALAACSAVVDPDKIKPTGPATLGALCQSVGPLLVDRFQACIGAPLAWVQDTFGGPDCAAMEASAAAGRMGYDRTYGDACANTVRTASCQDLFFSGASGPPGACAQAIIPQVPTGGTCTSGDECRPLDFCDRAATCGAGTCQPRGAVGDLCNTRPCQAGLACVFESAGVNRCQAAIGPNQPCPAGGGCQPGLYCDYDPGRTPPYLCLAQKTGGPCTAREACQPPGYVCSGTNVAWNNPGQCRQVAKEGESCKHGYGECVQGTYCFVPGALPPAIGTSGTCTIFPSPGGGCGQYGAETIECIFGYCDVAAPAVTGTCRAYRAAGSACTGVPWDECGKRNTCGGGVCQTGC